MLTPMRALRRAWQTWRLPTQQKEIVYVFTRFPWYPLTFIFQEMPHLKRRGLPLRLITLERGPREDLHGEWSGLWDLIEEIESPDPDEHRRNHDYFSERFPDRVRHLATRFAGASPDADPLTSDYLLPAFTLARQLLHRDVGYLHSHFTFRDSALAYMVGRLLRVPRGFTVHADCFVESPFKLLREQLEDSDLVVTLSQQAAAFLRELGGERNAGKLVLKRNGVDVRRVRRHGPPAPRGKLVSVCRLARKKGLGDLLHACRLLLDRGWPIQCDIIGDAEPTNPEDLRVKAELSATVEQLRLTSAVRLLGKRSREQVLAHLAESAIFVAPYVVTEDGRREVTPTSLIEAMAMELVPVTTDSGAIPELVEHDHTGLLIPQRDPKALAEAIEDLLRDERLYARLRRAARRTIERRFNLDRNERVFEGAVRRLWARG